MPERRTRRIPLDLDMPLVASATVVTPADEDRGRRNLFTYASWQDEAWAQWRSLGEFNYGVTWLANTISRVRLMAAESVPGGDEPSALDPDHPAAQLIASIGGSLAGQAALMKSWATHLSVPGDSWTVVEQVGARQKWQVYSAKTIRQPRRQNGVFQVQTDENRWRPLAPESLTIRVWNPDEEYHWRPFSFAESALPIMRTVDLWNRRIIATLVSRIAMNGFLIVPAEMNFQSRPEFKDAADPFVAELIEHASYAIKNPGTASAAIPFPVRLPAQWAGEFRHMAIDNGVDKELITSRDSELKRLATALHMPAEMLLGMGELNHWSGWLLEDSAIKTFISPPVEVIADGITDGYLIPALEAAGEPLVGPEGGAIVCWYDVSEVAAKPDKTESAMALYDRLELSGEALRRETGFEEADKPDDTALKDQVLKSLAKVADAGAVKELVGVDIAPAQPELPFGQDPAAVDDSQGVPDTENNPPPRGPTDNAPVVASGWVALNGHKQPVTAGR